MTRLATYSVAAPHAAPVVTEDAGAIAARLGRDGIGFERWPLVSLSADADDAAVLAAYAGAIGRLRAERGYATVDIVRMAQGAPAPEALRAKFLAEHRHDEDEVRFFVEGRGLFSLRDEATVHVLLCEAGDLISVPAGVRHWFDMGAEPHFTAIRLFTDPAGWVARYTGDRIAERFPRLEPAP